MKSISCGMFFLMTLSSTAAIHAGETFVPIDLSTFEQSVYSQNGEDGTLEKIFELIGILDQGYFVEFGAGSGSECNSRYFKENYGWQGLLMDSHFENESINLHKEWVTAENINDLLEKYQTPKDFDLLSIDIDFNDFHVWKAIDNGLFNPKVVIIEYNATHLPTEDRVVAYNPTGGWDGTNYFGASLLAFTHLGNEKGYSLVNTDKRGVNAIFVRNDLIPASPSIFKDINNVEALYHPAGYGYGPRGGHVADTLNRAYEDSSGNPVLLD